MIERRLTRLYKLSQPKHRATTKVTKQISSSVILKWDSDSNDAFEIMKKAISNAVALHHIDYTKPIHLEVDASTH